MTERWFGKNWGAPCCEVEAHVPTPIGKPCLRCNEPIREGDQGVIHWVWRGTGDVAQEPQHLECFLRSIRPHGPECPYCRGAERVDHDADCSYRVHGGRCDCRPLEGVP